MSISSLVIVVLIINFITSTEQTEPNETLKLEYRIQRGFLAEAGEFPMIVLLNGRTHRCTGSLIAPNKIVTAGHCACGDPTNKAYVNVTDTKDRYLVTSQMRLVTHFAYPLSYAKSCEALFKNSENSHELLGGAHDIAVLTTNKPFDLFHGYVETVKLGNFKSLKSDEAKDVITLGYGRDNMANSTGTLRFGFIKLLTCPNNIRINTVGALCAKLDYNFQSPDVGDSGGPLLSRDGHLIGVTSISGNGWIIFSSVYHHKKFIVDQLRFGYK